MKITTEIKGVQRVVVFLLGIMLIEIVSYAAIDVKMVLNDGGFVSYDRFKAELYLDNHGALVPDIEIFGILQILSEYYYWPAFTREVDYEVMWIVEGETRVTFLEFELPDIDDVSSFGPMIFWGAWFIDSESYGYDAAEFWFDSAHKWTPTPLPESTGTAVPPTNTPTLTPTQTPTPTPLSESTATVVPPTNTPTLTPTQTQTPPPAPTGFVYIAPGSLTMGSPGSPSSEPCRTEIEKQHSVTLTRGFYMMQTEVTRQMWADLKAVQPTLPNDPSNTTYSPRMIHPVQHNTWYESVLFANLMSVQNGFTRCYYKDEGFTTPVDATNYTSETVYCNWSANGFRLPTEAEWEYACRAGTTSAFSCSEPDYNWGNCDSCTAGTHPILEQYCVYCANDPGITEVVGSKLPNQWGLYDMHGNVDEWCWDWNGLYPSSSVTDPTGPPSGYARVLRGGSYDSGAWCCRSAMRNSWHPGYPFIFLGFRLVRQL